MGTIDYNQQYASVAQSAERHTCNMNVAGAIPATSSCRPKKMLQSVWFWCMLQYEQKITKKKM